MDNNIAGRIATAILCIGATSAVAIGAATQDGPEMEMAAQPSLSPQTKPNKSEFFDPSFAKKPKPVKPTLKSVVKKVRKPVSLKKQPKANTSSKRPKAPKPTQRPYTPRKTYSGVKEWARQQVGDRQFSCLDKLFTRESGWNTYATNPSSGAYGIPQALPASKMASAGADWKTNPFTQVRWGLNYIANRYGSPCGAWAHSQSVGWY
jgi:hypothetical protein